MESMEITDSHWEEIKQNLELVRDAIENKLSRLYSVTEKQGKKYFHSERFGDFHIHIMGTKPPWDFLVIAYKEEDGDGFTPSDYDSLNALVADMIAEIEG